MICTCSKHVLQTPFCPQCGGKKPVGKQKRYPVEGRAVYKPILAVRTDQFREPKKGEYYLSGAIPVAYRALSDLSSKFWICQTV